MKMRGLLVNDIPKYLVFLVWLSINILIFGVTFTSYENDVRYFYTRVLLGHTLAIARSAAACLNFNCMLILLPVCRNMLSFVRGWLECCPRRARRILDKNIRFHVLCAYAITVLTLVHYYAHTANVHRFATARTEPTDDTSKSPAERIRVALIIKLATLGTKDGETYLNPIRKPIHQTGGVFVLTGGWTGFIMALCLLLMLTSSTEFIRRSYFELFWYVHHLFIIFFGFMLFHGTGSQIRRQTNTDAHNPEFCSTVKPDEWTSTNSRCSTTPQFEGLAPTSWIWIIVPIIVYVCERILRLVRYMQSVDILNIVNHPSQVIEIQMKKRDFKANVGQYIFIQCPTISHLEWHPFTLTSAPEEDYFSVHIRIVGDWTSSLYYAVGADDYGVVHPSWKMPRLAVDGPFGTASENVFDYDVVLCVGSGIGVTPFASLLKSVYYRRVNSSNESAKLKKVYFFWICKEMHAFEWFADMLLHLENQLADAGQRDCIEYHIYLTRGWSARQARAIALSDEGDRDVITGLEQKTNFGRPNWDEVFQRITSQHVEADVGVFFCGVAALSAELHRMCNKHSTSSTTFHYNKENF